MKVREALGRLEELEVPGAREAATLVPSDVNAVVDPRVVAAPILIAATHPGASPVVDEAARLSDLNVPFGVQKRFAVLAVLQLGEGAWSSRARFHKKRLRAEARRLFEKTFVGFVFYKHRRLLITSATLLCLSAACVLGPMLLQSCASFWLERAATVMGTDLAVSLQYLEAMRRHSATYGRLKDVLGKVRSHNKATDETLSELGPFTEERIGELATKTASFFEGYDVSAFRGLVDRVDDGIRDWELVRNGTDLGTHQLAQLLRMKMAVFDPVVACITRATPYLVACLAVAMAVAVVKQVDRYLFEDDPSGRRRTGRAANSAFILLGVFVVGYAAYRQHDGPLPVVATVLCLGVVKQFFTAWGSVVGG
jgi:hypothetical protein